jgi:predicted DNA-binding protein
MPNQRKKGKKLVALWLSEEERAVLKKLAKKLGVTQTEYLKQKLDDHIRASEKQ